MRTYAPYVTFPAALVIGFVGYQVEKRMRNPDRDKDLTYLHKSVREERMLEEMKKANQSPADEYTSIKDQKFPVPRYTFDNPPPQQ